jgi:hypothetical protein
MPAKNVFILSIIIVLPVISVPEISPVIQGNELKLHCNIHTPGNPSVYTYRWQFEAKYPDSVYDTNFGSSSVLTISNSQRVHAGKYTCITHNEAGDITSSSNVVVYCK